MLSATQILDGDLLRALAAFADTRNHTHAARLVGLSQPAFFERVRRASELLGGKLYERQGRALVLTLLGERAAAFARESIERADAFCRSLDGEADAGRVTLAAGEGAFLYLLGPALARFTAQHAATLELLTLGGPAALEAVRTGRAHLAVAVQSEVPEGLRAEVVVRTPLCAAMSRHNPLAARRSLRLCDLSAERLILPPQGRSHRDHVSHALASQGAASSPPIEADGWPQMLAFAQAGLGVAVVNGICHPPRGVVLRPIRDMGQLSYRLFSRKGASPTAAAKALASLILQR